MEAINSKEKSKKVWQFIGVFAGLIMLPFALIAMAYIKLPDALTAEDKAKLEAYNKSYNQKNELVKILRKVNKCLTVTKSASSAPEVLDKAYKELFEATNKLEELTDSTSNLVTCLTNLINNDINRNATAQTLKEQSIKADKEIENALKKKQEQQMQMGAAAGGSAAAGLTPEQMKDPNSDYVGAPPQD